MMEFLWKSVLFSYIYFRIIFVLFILPKIEAVAGNAVIHRFGVVAFIFIVPYLVIQFVAAGPPSSFIGVCVAVVAFCVCVFAVAVKFNPVGSVRGIFRVGLFPDKV